MWEELLVLIGRREVQFQQGVLAALLCADICYATSAFLI
jgi:hypothetical protein